MSAIKTSSWNFEKKSYLIILLQSDIVTSHCDLIVRDFVNVHIQLGTFHPWTTGRIGPILVGNYATRRRHINRWTSATQFQKNPLDYFETTTHLLFRVERPRGLREARSELRLFERSETNIATQVHILKSHFMIFWVIL